MFYLCCVKKIENISISISLLVISSYIDIFYDHIHNQLRIYIYKHILYVDTEDEPLSIYKIYIVK